MVEAQVLLYFLLLIQAYLDPLALVSFSPLGFFDECMSACEVGPAAMLRRCTGLPILLLAGVLITSQAHSSELFTHNHQGPKAYLLEQISTSVVSIQITSYFAVGLASTIVTLVSHSCTEIFFLAMQSVYVVTSPQTKERET